jgi:molybdopterin converting factor small subunit
VDSKLKEIQERHDRAIAVEEYDFEPRSSVLDDRGELLRMVAELEAQKTPTPCSVAYVHTMSEQLVRTEDKLEKAAAVIADVQKLPDEWCKEAKYHTEMDEANRLFSAALRQAAHELDAIIKRGE